jgi:hypothetical protein
MEVFVLRYNAADTAAVERVTGPLLGTSDGAQPGVVQEVHRPGVFELRSTDRRVMRQLWGLTRHWVREALLLDED